MKEQQPAARAQESVNGCPMHRTHRLCTSCLDTCTIIMCTSSSSNLVFCLAPSSEAKSPPLQLSITRHVVCLFSYMSPGAVRQHHSLRCVVSSHCTALWSRISCPKQEGWRTSAPPSHQCPQSGCCGAAVASWPAPGRLRSAPEVSDELGALSS